MSIFKKERFSIRKFSVGAVSVLIGASLFAGNSVSADDENSNKKNVEVHYVVESSLTADEKAALKEFSDNQKVSADVEAYYYVYKANTKEKGVLPNTSSLPLKGIALAGTSLIVVALFVSKRRNKILMASAFAVGLSGVLSSTVLANEDFHRFFENVEVTIGGELPTPKNIEGYTFTGYYFTKNKEQSIDEKVVPNKDSESNNQENPVQPNTPEVPDKNVEPNKPQNPDENIEPNKPDKPADNKGVNTLDPQDEKENGTAENPEAKVRENDRTTDIPFSTKTEEDATIEKGQTQVKQEGKNGTKVETVREFYIVENGEEKVIYSEVIATKETPAVDKIVVVGTKETPQSAKGDQSDGGSANVEPALPEYPIDQVPKEHAKGDQNNGGSANVEPALPEYPVDQVPAVSEKGEPWVEPELPVSPEVPKEHAKGDQSDGGSANVEPTLPEYPVDQVPPVTDKGEANVEPALPEYPIDQVPPVTDKGEANTEPALPEAMIKRVEVKTEEVPFETEYRANTELEYGKENIIQKGKNGSYKVVRDDIYNGDKLVNKGEEQQIEKVEATKKIVELGTKPTTKTEDIDFATTYIADTTLEYGRREEKQGQKGSKITTTTYTLNTETGEVTENTQTTEETPATNAEVKVGTKPTVMTEEIVSPVRYEADETKDYGSENERTEGRKGSKTTTTTYTLNTKTGEVTADAPTVETKEATATIIKVGVKATEKSEDLPVVYKRDDNQEVGRTTEIEGTPKVITTTYTVDATTGVVTPNEQVTQQGVAKVVTKGTKAKVEEKELPFTTTYKADSTIAYNTKETEVEGKAGKEVTTTTYSLDEKTGEVTANTPTTETTQATNAVVKVGNIKVDKEVLKAGIEYQADSTLEYKKQVETEGKDGEKTTTTTYKVDDNGNLVDPSSETQETAAKNTIIKIGNVETTTSPITITEKEIADPNLEKGKTEIREQGEEGLNTTTTTYEVNPQTGELTKFQTSTVETKAMKQRVIAKGTKEDVEKKVDFNDVTKRELYVVKDNGEMEVVTGLSELPADSSKYILKLVRQNHKDVFLPVSSIAEEGESFKVISKGEEFLDDEGMTLSKVKTYPGAYTQFDKLLEAMKANTAGTFEIGADLVANQLKDIEGEHYISNFTGTLKSAAPNKNFTISNLNKPLFNTLQGATVKNINLDVDITASKAAALAITANNATIDNVHAKGKLAGTVDAAGIAVDVSGNSKLTDVSMTGDISITKNPTGGTNLETGGIVSRMSGGTIDRALADISYLLTYKGGYSAYTTKYVGGIVGQLSMGTSLSNAVVKGTITTNFDGSSNVGAIVGVNVGSVTNTLNMVSNVATSFSIVSPFVAPATNTNILNTIPNAGSSGSKLVSAAEADKLIKDWKVKSFADASSSSSTTDNSSLPTTLEITDYTKVDGADATKKTTYENISKLLPFYDAKTIVKYGNKVDASNKLATSKILSVVTLVDEVPTNITTANKEKINKLLIHFADGTVEKYDISSIGAYKDSAVYEYKLGEDLIFTPEQLLTDKQDLVKQLVAEFKKVDFNSEGMQKAVKLDEYNKDKEEKLKLKMDDLFWKSTFQDVQENIEDVLSQLLSSDDVLGSSDAISQATKQRLLNNKEKILTGLSYISRLYDIHYGHFSLKNIMLYHPEFYGTNKDVFSWLTSFSDLDFKELQVQQNYKTFTKQFSNVTNSADLVKFLENNKDKFDKEQTMAEWFKANIKATVYEVKSKENPDIDVSLYSWLTSNKNYYAHYLLPLLNLRDSSIYATTNMTFMGFGLKDRHIDQLTRNNPMRYKEALEKLEKETIPKYAQRWSEFADTWYRIVDESVKAKLIKPRVSLYSGYFLPGEGVNSWLSAYDTKYKAMEDFFTATGNWFDDDIRIAAYAAGSSDIDGYHTELNFRRADMLSNSGNSTLTHEYIHALDHIALLNGYGRRPGQDQESYALGLLESVRTENDYYYGFNLIQDFEGKLANHNQTNARFQSSKDAAQFMKGMFDLTYVLDSVEAEQLLKLSKQNQRIFLDKVDMVYDNEKNKGNSIDRIRAITDDEWNKMTLTSISDLIDNNLVKRDSITNKRQNYVRSDDNNYYYISLYSPIYAAAQNEYGTGGGWQFRKTALELMAAKGWDEGFIPFVSDKLAAQAKTEGKVLSDKYVFDKIMNGEYSSYAELKKAKYKDALEKVKAGKLKGFTINYLNQDIVIDSYEALSNLMKEALEKDIEYYNNFGKNYGEGTTNNYVPMLKSAIFKAVQNITNDMRDSIYKN